MNEERWESRKTAGGKTVWVSLRWGSSVFIVQEDYPTQEQTEDIDRTEESLGELNDTFREEA